MYGRLAYPLSFEEPESCFLDLSDYLLALFLAENYGHCRIPPVLNDYLDYRSFVLYYTNSVLVKSRIRKSGCKR